MTGSSRFSRNTVDLLKVVRYLTELGIEIRFEKEGMAYWSEERRQAQSEFLRLRGSKRNYASYGV